MAELIDLQAHRAARQSGAAASAVEPTAADLAPRDWICRLDVFAPATPGAAHRAAFLAFNMADDGLSAPARLDALATAFEQIATSLRNAAQADAV